MNILMTNAQIPACGRQANDKYRAYGRPASGGKSKISIPKILYSPPESYHPWVGIFYILHTI